MLVLALQVNEKNKEYMTKALETAAKDAEKINYLTAQLTQLETDKVRDQTLMPPKVRK